MHPFLEDELARIGDADPLPPAVAMTDNAEALVLDVHPVALQPLDRSYHGIFDLCIEAPSDSRPGEAERDKVTKKAEYLAAGVREYYIRPDNDGAGPACQAFPPANGISACSSGTCGFPLR
jgi:hypothetical protein